MSTKSKEIAIIKDVPGLVKIAKGVTITGPKQMTDAVGLLSTLNKKLDLLKADRKKITAPIKASVKEIESRYKPSETMLSEAIETLRKMISGYQTESKRLAEEEEARIAARVGEGKGKLKAETAIAKMGEIERPEEHVATDAGSVKFRTDRKFQLESFDDLPNFIKGKIFTLAIEKGIVDQVLRAELKTGKEYPGVKYWDEETPINSR